METKLELASGWKLLCGIAGIVYLYYFARIAYEAIELLRELFNSEAILFRIVSVVFALLFFLVVLAFLALMAYLFLYKFGKERLVIHASGIEHEAFGYKLYSNWANLQRIKSPGTLGQLNGIYVTPTKVEKWIRLPIKQLVDINVQGEYFIPLSMFDRDWRDSELGRQIKQYAPHLFQ